VETRFKGNARVLGEDDLVPLGSKSNSDPDCFGIPEVIDKQCLRKPSSIVVVGDTAYTLSNGYNTLTAFDVNDPQQIRVLSMSTNGLMRPTQVMIGGSLAYVANDDGIRALVVFDISGPALTAVGTLEGTANPGKALDVFVAGSFAYLVGREPSPFLAVVDVSDLGNMVVRGSAPTGGRAVHVEGSLAVVADADGNRLAVYDVSDPENPGLIGSSSELAASPSSVYVSGSRAYVTMEGSNALVVYDLNPPASPTVLGSIAGSFVTPVSVVVSGDYAFVASEGQPVTAENSGVTVFDVSDPSAIVTRGSTGLVGMSATSVFVSGNRVFVASECKSEECSVLLNDDGFIVFEFNHLESPTLRAGNLQAGYLDVTDSASVTNGLSVGGGLNAGLAHVGGNLGVGGDFGLGGDLRMLGAIGGEDDFVCTEFNVFDECTSWTDPKLTFTNDIFLDGHRILGSTYVHCPEGQYLSGLDCCGVYEFDGPAVCLPDVTNVSFAESDLAIAVDGNLVPACDAGGCPPAIGGWDLGHPELRWDDIWAANGVIQTSDARLKDNVMPLAAGLEEVMALDPVTFNWKGGSERHTGLIAQHVRQVMPGLVRGGDDPGGMLGINYAELVPVLINALQDLQGEIAGQARTIESLQARLARLE
jgi:hypothetical protein